MINTIKNIMLIFNEEYGEKFIITDSKVKVWIECLKDFDKETILSAGMHLVSTGGAFPPVIGQVRQQCVNLRHGEMNVPPGPDAWIAVLAEVQKSDGAFLNLPELTREALKSVGTMFDLKRSDNIAFERNHFLKAYAAIVEMRQKERVMLPTVRNMNNHNAPALPRPEPAENPRALQSHETAEQRIPTHEEIQRMTQGVIDAVSIQPDWNKGKTP